MGKIDYDNECMNENHISGCLCGEGVVGAKEEAERKGSLKTDPYRPESPNILSFGRANQTSKYDNVLSYWVLRDSAGGRIAGSADYFESKELAMRNCIAIFGKEIWAGYHIAATEEDHNLLLALGIEYETRVV